MTDKCFACDKKLGKNPKLVTCIDDQTVFVGSDCFKKIAKAGCDGYQPSLGGPKLFTVEAKFLLQQDAH